MAEESPQMPANPEMLESHRIAIQEIFTSHIPFHLIGGYAFSAIAEEGKVTETRQDIDVVIPREYEDQARDFFEKQGYEVTERHEVGLDAPSKLYAKRDTVKIDCVLVDHDMKGIHFFFPDKDGKKMRVDMSDNLFDTTPRNLFGSSVRTVSPADLATSFKFYADAGLDPLREKDAARVEALENLGKI